jgi:hypothetical protein
MKRGRNPSGMTANAKAVINAKGWNVSVFNGGCHLRINGVVDVWPTRRRWMPTQHGPGEYAEVYRDLSHLRTIVKTQEELQESKASRAAKWFASLPEGEEKKEPVQGVATWEEFGLLFDGPRSYSSQPKLFESRAEIKPPQSKFFTAFAPQKPLRPFVDDGRPPWE